MLAKHAKVQQMKPVWLGCFLILINCNWMLNSIKVQQIGRKQNARSDFVLHISAAKCKVGICEFRRCNVHLLLLVCYSSLNA